jgi:hypothetical protein
MILTDVRQGCGVGVQKMYTRAIGGHNVKAFRAKRWPGYGIGKRLLMSLGQGGGIRH